MQRATRNYAKRQVTWFRREPAAEWMTVHGDGWVNAVTAALLARMGGAGVGMEEPQGRPMAPGARP
jgi:hypothetical protein